MGEPGSQEEEGLDWAIVETVSLLPFVLLQVSMVVFLLRRGRTEKSYRQAFYVFFIVVTITDCSVVVVKRLGFYFSTAINALAIANTQWDGDEPIIGVMRTIIRILTQIETIGSILQPLLHTIISFNRFTALAFLLQHSSIWRPRTVLVATIVAATVSVVPVAFCFVYFGVYYAQHPTPHVGVVQWDFGAHMLSELLGAIIMVVCCLVSLLVNVCTVLMFVRRRLDKTQQNRHGQDLRLFLHTLFMFTLQSYLSLQCFAEATDYFYNFVEIPNLMPPGTPRWAVLNSRQWLIGRPKCEPHLEYLKPEEMKKYCGVLHGILSGSLGLGGHFNLLTLTEYVFALADTPFLLLVSGTVRSAYFRFYFQRFMRQKTKVVQVTGGSMVSNKLTTRPSQAANT